MRFYITLLLMPFFFLQVSGGPAERRLDSGWTFRQARQAMWCPAVVPGVVHTDLMANGIIEDPYFRLNERGVQWVDKEDWIYLLRFDADEELYGKNNIELCFMGLDTYADVYLNDSLIVSADNMFRTWSADGKNLLKLNDNKLEVYFHSPVKIDMPKWEALPFRYMSSNDQSENGGLLDRKIGIFSRKAGYHYGWDWGPRLVTCGIWRPVVIRGWDDARISGVYHRQIEVTAKKAVLKTEVEIDADSDIAGAEVTVSDKRTGKVIGTTRTAFTKGKNRVEVDYAIKSPKLWWSNGLGEPHMYDLVTTVGAEGRTVDKDETAVGLRSLRLVTDDDLYGTSFYFELNGVPVFAKGANYIPCDNFLPRVTEQIYERTVLDAVAANMNMLRIWGGGTYEDDIFYELCDRHGIMIWQDFMFACSLYPAEGEFLENIRLEAVDNVKRLRNHPCIAVWCGNNECHEAWYTWGWKRHYERQDPEYADIIWRQMQDQYHVVLPEVVREYAPGVPYRPSSPYSRNEGPSEKDNGDRHYWGVWHDKKPIKEYNNERGRFFSEYGFQSFPEFGSVRKYAPEPEDWSIDSEVMMSHQRGGDFANELIETYLLMEYRKPVDFEAFTYSTIVLQGDAIKTAVEAHRRDRPYCMGTLFWQHNDTWPVASWSSRDWYGRWKAQHYFARKAYDDVLVSPIEEEGALKVYIVSDRLKGIKGELTVSFITLAGQVLSEERIAVEVPGGSSTVCYSLPMETVPDGFSRTGVVAKAVLTVPDGSAYTNNYFFASHKEMSYTAPNIRFEVSEGEGKHRITLSADRFARAVYLSTDAGECFFGGNYIDIFPGETIDIDATTGMDAEELARSLKLMSLAQAGNY